jgi:hypothetical protein
LQHVNRLSQTPDAQWQLQGAHSAAHTPLPPQPQLPNGRPFCLYVVAGSRAYLPGIIAEVNAVLAHAAR